MQRSCLKKKSGILTNTSRKLPMEYTREYSPAAGNFRSAFPVNACKSISPDKSAEGDVGRNYLRASSNCCALSAVTTVHGI